MTNNGKVVNLTDESFEKVTSTGISIVDFWAPWCAPCKIQGPILDSVAKQVKERVTICKINVDEYKESAMGFGITGIPTLLVFKDGKVAKQFIGVQDEQTLLEAVSQ